MTITIDVWTLVFLFSAFHGLLLSGLLLGTRQKRSYIPNRWMVALLLTFSGMLLIFIGYWNHLQLTVRYIHLNYSHWPFSFLIGPLMYLYLKSQVEPSFKGAFRHLLLPTAVLLFWMPFYVLSSEGKVMYFANKEHLSSFSFLWDNILVSGSLLQTIFYAGLNFQIIRKIGEEMDANGIRAWLRKLSFAFAIYASCHLVYYILVYRFQFPVEWDYSLSLIMASMIYYIGSKAYSQPNLFKEREQLGLIQKKSPQELIPAADFDFHQQRILEVMEKERPYLNDQLKLNDVAALLELSPHQLSYLLNRCLNKSFSDFIGTYRVKEAKKILLDPRNRHLKIVAIGYDAGFSSKTAFFTTFKRFTGLTPAAFRKRVYFNEPTKPPNK